MGIAEFTLPETIDYQSLSALEKDLESFSKSLTSPELGLDFSHVQKIDSAGALFIQQFHEKLEAQGIRVHNLHLSPEIERTLLLFQNVPSPPQAKAVASKNFFERLGEQAYEGWRYFVDSTMLFSDLFYWSFVAFFSKHLRRKGEVIHQGILVGVNALPIIALISFLIGFILALQSAAQLRQFGASIYVADLVAVAMVSEMAPLITAILIAGRSGSAITAEIATMKVTEEIDALIVMGVDPLPYLIIPKFYALLISLPLLTIFANVIGIIGGAIIGFTYLQIDFLPFFREVLSALSYKDILTGLTKSVVFAVIILFTATYFGFKARGGAEGVGRVTTSSVVASIFFVIVADSLLGLLFYFGGPAF
jgi:phospholipid/cholesterol/gamma-HCH transport system permease protein